MPEQSPNLHVLLIGIDYYKPNRLYRSLRGAVRDISLVETFLKKTLKVPGERIHKLTSINPEAAALLEMRLTPDQEPTYTNIVQAFNVITQMAHSGEQVYIHYAGHGGRATTIYPFKQESRDEGIVPMDIGDTEAGRYLRDVEMATLLKRMTDKGLIVTVVLDCCHAGGKTRGDMEIRSAGQTDTMPRLSHSLVAELEVLERNWLDLTQNGVIAAAGLPVTRKYVLLAACRADEYAYEYAVNGGTEQNGALTYWMIDTLTSAAISGQPLTYKLLHDRINAQIQSKLPQQTPVLLGDGDRRVFGSDTWLTPFTVTVIKVITDHQITINAGQAQGLSNGTRFSIYPLNTTDFTDKTRQVAIAELTQVNASESTAKIIPIEEGGVGVRGELEPGSPAVMISAPIELVQKVRFSADKTEGELEDELPANLVHRQQDALDRVRQALMNNGWIKEEKGEEIALYQVAIDRKGNYEICKAIPISNLRPLLSIDDPTAPNRVVNRLVHLAKYQAVESLDNSSSKLANVLDVEILTVEGVSFPDSQNITVHHEDVICLRLANTGHQPLKLAVLDLEPTWAISQIPIGGIEAPFFDLDQGAVTKVLLQLRVPDNSMYQQTKEIIKVFAVEKGLADFRWLTLPPLDELPNTRGGKLDEEFKNMIETITTRSAGQTESNGINPLHYLLTMIGKDSGIAPKAQRSASIVVDPSQEWVTKQIQVFVER
ncbi:MAG: caspase family protein [Thainema sp.]